MFGGSGEVSASEWLILQALLGFPNQTLSPEEDSPENQLRVQQLEFVSRYVHHDKASDTYELDVSDQRLEADDFEEILQACEATNNTRITTIKACSNRLGLGGARHIVAAIRHSKELADSLQQLTLGMNELGDDGAIALAAIFDSHSGNPDDTSPQNIASALKVLDLRWNNIGRVGVEAVCRGIGGLGESCSLQVLNLDRNRLGNASAEFLAQHVLAKPKSKLHTVILSGNSITGPGVQAIADAIKPTKDPSQNEEPQSIFLKPKQDTEFPGLQHLDMRWNRMGCEGAIALADALRTNETLLSLDLSGTRIEMDGLRALHEAITEYNDTILTLELDGNKFTSDPETATVLLREINECLEGNSPIPKYPNRYRRIAPAKAHIERQLHYKWLLKQWVDELET